MCMCRPRSVEPRRPRCRRSIAARGVARASKPNFGVGLAGRDRRRGCRRSTPGVIAQQDALAAGPRRERRPSRSSVVEVVDHDPADAGARPPRAARPSTWRCRAGRSARGRSRPRARGAARRRRRRRSPAPPPRSSRSTAVHGNALEANSTSPWSPWLRGAAPARNVARARAQVVLGDDVGGRAELARQLDRVAAADLEAAGASRTRRSGVDVRSCRGGHERRDYARHAHRHSPRAELGERDGLAYALWLPEDDRGPGVVILHGAGSRKENHARLRRAAAAARPRGRLLRPARARRQRRRARRPRARRRGDRSRRCCPAGLPARAARVEHGRLPGARRRRAAGAAGRRRDLPGERRRRCCARAARRRASTSRADVAALDAFLAEHPLERGRRARCGRRCCSCTPRATRRCRSPALARWRAAREPGARALEVVAGRRPPLGPARRRARSATSALRLAARPAAARRERIRPVRPAADAVNSTGPPAPDPRPSPSRADGPAPARESRRATHDQQPAADDHRQALQLRAASARRTLESLRRMNSTRKRSIPASTSHQREQRAGPAPCRAGCHSHHATQLIDERSRRSASGGPRRWSGRCRRDRPSPTGRSDGLP